MKINYFSMRLYHLTPETYFRWIIRRRLVILLITAFFTILPLSSIPRLVFTTSVHDMVIDDLDETGTYEHFKMIFGSDEMIRVVISCENIFASATFIKLERLVEELGSIDNVYRTISLPDVKKVVDISGTWSMDTFRDRVKTVPLFHNNLLSSDHRTTLVTLMLKDGADYDSVIEDVQHIIDREGTGLTLYQMGMPIISNALARFTKRDFFHLPPVTFLVMALILFGIYRNFRDVLLPLVCVTLSLVWTLGILSITGSELSILTMIVPVFLIAVGTAYCLHIVAEYHHQLNTALSPEQATLGTFSAIYFPTIIASVTTILGLGSLVVSHICAIQTFSLIACGGIFSFSIIVLTFLPAALSYMPLGKPTAHRKSPSPGIVQSIIDSIISLNLNHRKVTLPFLAVVVVICVAGIFRLKVETNPVDYFRENTEVRQNFEDIHQRLSGCFPVNVMITGSEEDYFQQSDSIEMLDKFQKFVETLPGVDKAISFSEYMKLVNYASNRYDPRHYRLPEESFEVRMLVNSFRMLLGRDILEAFISPDFSRANVMLFTHITSSRDFLRLREQIESHASAHLSPEARYAVTGFGIVLSSSSKKLTMGQINSLFLTMIMVFAIKFLLFLSWKVGLIAIATNLFPIVVNFGIMGWLGIELSMATSLIASVAIGLAVDDTIHYLVRFNREFKKDLDSQRALRVSLNRLGRPIIYTSVTIGIGFSILIFSGFKPTAVFGAMMAITVFSALIGDLILLPSLMQFVELVTLWDLVRIRLGRDPNLEIPLFQGFSRTELHSILMAGTLRPIAQGEELFKKGDPSDTMYAIISGRFEIIDYEAIGEGERTHGIKKHIKFAEKGDIVGEMGLLRSTPRSATVVSIDSGELLPINWNVIRRLQWLYPPTALKFLNNLITILCNRVENMTQCLTHDSHVDDLTRLCNRKGLCRIIDLEISRAKRTGQPLTLFRIDLTFSKKNDQMADMVLQRLSKNFLRCIRGCDTLSRTGTKQFALLTNGANYNELALIRRRMEKATDRIRSEFDNDFFSILITAIPVPLKEKNSKRILERALSCQEEIRAKST